MRGRTLTVLFVLYLARLWCLSVLHVGLRRPEIERTVQHARYTRSLWALFEPAGWTDGPSPSAAPRRA